MLFITSSLLSLNSTHNKTKVWKYLSPIQEKTLTRWLCARKLVAVLSTCLQVFYMMER